MPPLDPLTLGIVSAAIGAGGQIADFLAARDAAKSRARFERKKARLNKALALESLGEQTFDLRLRTIQERAQIGEEIGAVIRQSILQRGGIAAQAGGAGVAGTTVAELDTDAQAQRQVAEGSLRLLQEFRELAAEREARALELQARGRILSGQPGPVAFPSAIGAAFATGAAGLQGFASGSRLGGAL